MDHGKTRQMTRRSLRWAMKAPPLESQESEIQSAELQKRAEEQEVEQTALLEASLSGSRYIATLAVYVEAKQEQVERLEGRLENLIKQQSAKLQESQSGHPGLFAIRGARTAWQQQQARQQARIQCLQNRLENVREIREGMDIHGPKIEWLAARKLRAREPELATDWDNIRLAHRQHQAIQRTKQEQKQGQKARSQALRQERYIPMATHSSLFRTPKHSPSDARRPTDFGIRFHGGPQLPDRRVKKCGGMSSEKVDSFLHEFGRAVPAICIIAPCRRPFQNVG